MMKLWTFLAIALVVLAAPTAHGQSANNQGARVGRAGYLMNVVAFARCPAGHFAGSNRRTIAVQADYLGLAADKASSVNKIVVRSGADFNVQDGNACDQNGASFQLPVDAANCRNCASSTPIAPTFRQYEVRARVLGKRTGTATITGCVEKIEVDPQTQAETPTSLCSVGQSNFWVGSGDRWENLSQQLLTVCVDTTGDGVCDDRVGLFDSVGRDYWWSFDTAGRPHVQLVFFGAPQVTGGN